MEHLSDDELKAILKAIQDQIMADTADHILHADLDELQEEYAVYSAELESRLGYAQT